jgi:energy-coupling factor transporter ATP-binding protein EcfA2
MQTAHRPEPRTASVDDYSRFFFASNHCTIPIVATPKLPSSPKGFKRKRSTLEESQEPVATGEHGVGDSSTSTSQASDPSLENRPYGTCLIIGRSGTGKSTLLKHLVSRMPPRRLLYLVNVRADESEEYARSHAGGPQRVRHVQLSALREVASHSTIIIEDIISMKEREQASLREGMNYTAHHRSCKIFCVTHTVYKTGIFSMMPLFHYVVFTSSRANLPIVKQTLQRFSMTKAEVSDFVDAIEAAARAAEAPNSSQDPRSTYFFFDCARMQMGYSTDRLKPGKTVMLGEKSSGEPGSRPVPASAQDNRTEADSGRSADPKNRDTSVAKHFAKFFADARQRETADGVLRLVMNSAAARQNFNPGDLSFAFARRDGGREKVSLVDYAHVLTTAAARPTEGQKVLHRFLRARISLPLAAVSNATLRGLD